ncbi:MAG: glycosyltransferase family 4 protein [Anaerolineae bacterium]|nr:glycosyltransferase family 4 protein [Anaerolineae bacterium]MCB0212171.1 glycosyltransferase family 4 protein [Anaerolineae bacterium]
MKILFSSLHFYPSIGGSETNAEILAGEFTKLNHQVIVVTQTSDLNKEEKKRSFPFQVVRQPSPIELVRLVMWSDVCIHNGIMLTQAWPLLIIRRPWVIRHQVWLRSIDGTLGKVGGNENHWKVQLKHFVTRFATSISISHAIADHLHHPATVIPNPYRNNLFRILPNVSRIKELVFLGRLVSEKGADVLLRALSQLQSYNLCPQLTIIGTGPEQKNLIQMASELGIKQQVDFAGVKIGDPLVKALNEHQIMVVPSIYHEPFGVVALEGIACGCVVIGSAGGGLKDAIGPCGMTFPNGDVEALTQALYRLLTKPQQLADYRARAAVHLARHDKTQVARQYLQVMEQALWPTS